MKSFRKFNLTTHPSHGYKLTPIEFKDVVPFGVQRVYYITHFESNATTGEHCHKIEEEVFVVVQGSCTAVIDDGAGKQEFAFNEGEAMYVPNFVWHGFKGPSANCIILALSSTNYDASREDYVEDYEEFRKMQ